MKMEQNSTHNHSELAFVNQLARDVGVGSLPFPTAEVLQPDTGERFFSEYLTTVKPAMGKYDENDMCLCRVCIANSTPSRLQSNPPPQQQDNNIVATTNVACCAGKTMPTNNVRDLNRLQQQKQQQQQQQQQAGMAHRQPSPPLLINGMSFSQLPSLIPFPTVMRQPFLSFQPHQQQIPTYYYTPDACCAKYRTWLMKRSGRPPHDAHCHVKRNRQQQQQQQQQETDMRVSAHYFQGKAWEI